jgi:sigma-B regulation protein RsbU (phosphoserine phosphatase)
VEAKSLKGCMSKYMLRLSLVVLCFWMTAPIARAQTFDATALREPTELTTGWLVHAGDDPAYAQPGFDDSQWAQFDSRNSLRDVLPNANPGIVWYRLHLKVLPSQRGLALQEWYLASAFEIYANGVRLMKNGQVSPYIPYTFDARLLAPIPTSEMATGSVLLAVRLHMSPQEWDSSYPGLYHTNLTVGQEHEMRTSISLRAIGELAAGWLGGFFALGLGLVSLALYLSQRERREYLWLSLFTLFQFLILVPWAIFQSAYNFPPVLRLIGLPLQLGQMTIVLFVFDFLRVRIRAWVWVYIAIVAMALTVVFLAADVFNLAISRFDLLTSFVAGALFAGVLPVLVFLHWRKGNREAGILLIPLLLYSVANYASLTLRVFERVNGPTYQILALRQWIFAHPVGSFTLSIEDLAFLLFLLSLTIIVVLRSMQVSRQQATQESELVAAAGVQQLILPQQVETVPGFQVEAAYLPAQQVGGDFFQVVPGSDGGVLVVIGDVAGKGLPAAMLVSVLVGAIRTAARYTTDPADLLAELNNLLVGRTHGGFSTAVVAYLAADGQCQVANAGHLSPYLDGHEVMLGGALPLGIVAGTAYDDTAINLQPGSRLTFYSDGVVEAMNGKRELFGFERAQALATEPATAIAEAARSFGQEDDITVITIERLVNADLKPPALSSVSEVSY